MCAKGGQCAAAGIRKATPLMVTKVIIFVMRRGTNLVTIAPRRFPAAARSQPTERTAPMRKPLGKLGEANVRPFPHATTLFLLISAAYFLVLPKIANA